MKYLHLFALFNLMQFSCCLMAMQVRKIYSILPSCEYKPIRASDVQSHRTASFGNSFTHSHLQKALKSNPLANGDIGSYLQTIYPFSDYSFDERFRFSQLILKSIELERRYSSTHDAFFHGTLTTKLILLRTLLEQTRQRKTYQDFFLLRNKGTIDHLRGKSGYQYTIEKLRELYARLHSIGRFDNDQPMRSDLLSVNTAMLVGAREGNCEDSISYLDKTTRFIPADLDQKIDECLKIYGINNLSEPLRYFLKKHTGSVLAIFIPRTLSSSLTYISYPFGVPVGLPLNKLLNGEISQREFQEIVKKHKEYPPSKFFTQSNEFHQARILLNSQYFEENTGGIKMHLFMWEHEDAMKELHEKFSAIASLIP